MLETHTRLLVDPATHQVLAHEDVWENVAALPLMWRQLNGHWMHAVFRMLGWERLLRGTQAAVP